MFEPPLERGGRAAPVHGGPENGDDVDTVDAAGLVVVGGLPDGNATGHDQPKGKEDDQGQDDQGCPANSHGFSR